MTDSALRLLYDSAKKREWSEIATGDTLDVKASILLTVVALVATITGLVLAWPALPQFPYLKVVQVASVCLLSLSAALGVAALRPRGYRYEVTPDAYADWIQGLEQFYKPGEVTDAVIMAADFKEVSNRFQINKLLNAQKSDCLFWCFWTLVPAVAIALVSLLLMALHLAGRAA
ncbi:MAG TPA: hypothetical protein VJS43_17135 [Candidatus Acidoferrales bacterium]|nr:hypothetical protein [Candidatus Acidoferrales bacterium]